VGSGSRGGGQVGGARGWRGVDGRTTVEAAPSDTRSQAGVGTTDVSLDTSTGAWGSVEPGGGGRGGQRWSEAASGDEQRRADARSAVSGGLGRHEKGTCTVGREREEGIGTWV
jgi:hypothetical protein